MSINRKIIILIGFTVVAFAPMAGWAESPTGTPVGIAPAPIPNADAVGTGAPDLKVDLSAGKVTVNWDESRAVSRKSERQDPAKINHKKLGYIFGISRADGRGGAAVYAAAKFSGSPKVDLTEFEPGHEYKVVARAIEGFQTVFKSKAGDVYRNHVATVGQSGPISVTVPHGFVGQTDASGSQGARVSLAELSAHRDQYDGKIIEVAGYIDRSGNSMITSSRYKSDGGISDGTFGLSVLNGAALSKKSAAAGGPNYVVLIGYFFKEQATIARFDGTLKDYVVRLEPRYYFEPIATVSSSRR